MDVTDSIHWLHSRRGGREDAQENELAGVMLSIVSPFVNVGNFCGARIRERDQSIDLFLMVIRKTFYVAGKQ